MNRPRERSCDRNGHSDHQAFLDAFHVGIDGYLNLLVFSTWSEMVEIRNLIPRPDFRSGEIQRTIYPAFDQEIFVTCCDIARSGVARMKQTNELKAALPLHYSVQPNSKSLHHRRGVYVFVTLFLWCSYTLLWEFPHPRKFGSENPAYLVKARHGAVASENHRCSSIGVDILKDGGNAVDAAIAATFCTGVVNMFS